MLRIQLELRGCKGKLSEIPQDFFDNLYDSFRLPDHCSVYQEEVTSKQEENIKPVMMVIKLFSDSQAVLKTLALFVENSKSIMECRRSLNEMAKHYKIRLIEVSGISTLRVTVLQMNWLEKRQSSKSYK